MLFIESDKHLLIGSMMSFSALLIFLQQWNSIEKPNTNLLLFDADKNELKTIEKNLNAVIWEMKRENDENLILICKTEYEIKTYRI